MDLQGQDVIAFVREQQEQSREERRLQREADKEAREHELEIIRLRGNRQNNNQDVRNNAKSLKLPCCNEKTDSMDLYINCFERYARASQWRNEDWATSLWALLTGKERPAVGRRPQFKCFSCRKPGHITSNCHQKKFSAAGAATEEHQDFVGTTSPTE